jgi:ribonuclease D
VLGRLKAIAAWREREAQAKNLPRGRLIKDETIADLAGHPPQTQADLGRVRGLSTSWATNDIGARLLRVIEEAQPLPDEEMPAREDRKPGLGKDGALVADLLKLLLKIRARDADCRLQADRPQRGARTARRRPPRRARDDAGLALRSSSAATRSTSSKAASPLRSCAASWS